MSGQYIIYCDSDDWIERDMYEKLLKKALVTCADIVACDYYDDYINYSRTSRMCIRNDER